MQVYTNNKLSYPLTNNEIKIIDKVWEFLNNFIIDTIYLSDYRNNIIKKIKEKYTIEEFYLYETILDKLIWNLINVLKPFWTKKELFLCNKTFYKTEEEKQDIIKEIKNTVYYRSFINKICIIDYKNKVIYHKLQEGSSSIFCKNYFNLLIMSIIFNKSKYIEIMNNLKLNENNIKLPEFYFQFDYAFPNISLCYYNIGDKEMRIDRINKLYYNNNCIKNWFKII